MMTVPTVIDRGRRRQGHDRVRYYQLPELTAARTHFAHVTGITL